MNAPSSSPPISFTLPIDVVDDDIDSLGHASNIAYVRWIQDVALAHSEAVGLGFDAYRELGAIFVVRRQEIDYLRPVLRGQRLQVRTWIDSVFAAKCRRATEIVRSTTSESSAGGGERNADEVVARAMTTWGFIEFASGRPTRIANSARSAFGVPAR